MEAEGIAKKTEQVAAADAGATRVRLTAEADGNKAIALAAAEGIRANQLATAAGTEAALMATAKGKEATLLAEATGTRELAEALKQLDEKGKMLMIMDRLPPLIREGGEAGSKVLSAIFEPMGTAVGAIDSVRIIDMGGNGGGKTGMERFAGSIPAMLAEMLTKAEASGIDIKPLAKLLRIDATKLSEMVGLVDMVVPEVETTAAKK